MSIVKRKGKRIDFYLDDESYKLMLELCKNHGITKSEFLRKAVKHFIKINAAAEVRKQVKELHSTNDIRRKLNIDQLTAKKGD